MVLEKLYEKDFSKYHTEDLYFAQELGAVHIFEDFEENEPVVIFHEVSEPFSTPKGIYFNKEKRTTVIKWKDNTITKVTCQPDEIYDKEKGIALCYMKKANNNKSSFNEILKRYSKEEENE